MTQVILIDGVKTANPDLLDQQLKAIAPDDCYGITIDINGLHIVVSDSISAQLLGQLKTAVQNHNPAQLTTAQQAEITGKQDTTTLIAAADTALAQLATKLATFQATPTLANASPLLVEIAQDLHAVIKFNKYIAKKFLG